jgi:hypothetical protein
MKLNVPPPHWQFAVFAFLRVLVAISKDKGYAYSERSVFAEGEKVQIDRSSWGCLIGHS